MYMLPSNWEICGRMLSSIGCSAGASTPAVDSIGVVVVPPCVGSTPSSLAPASDVIPPLSPAAEEAETAENGPTQSALRARRRYIDLCGLCGLCVETVSAISARSARVLRGRFALQTLAVNEERPALFRPGVFVER